MVTLYNFFNVVQMYIFVLNCEIYVTEVSLFT